VEFDGVIGVSKGVFFNSLGDLTVEYGGIISADGTGYAAATGPAKGTGSSGGGAYGGNGGGSTGGAANLYGLNISSPTEFGSGGVSAAGGGAIHIATLYGISLPICLFF
jgi:hypothetical protein